MVVMVVKKGQFWVFIEAVKKWQFQLVSMAVKKV